MRALYVVLWCSLVGAVPAADYGPATRSAVTNADPVSSTQPALIIDHRSVVLAERLDDQALAAARRLRVAYGFSGGQAPLLRGLAALEREDPNRWTMRRQLSAASGWYGEGGLGSYPVGTKPNAQDRTTSMTAAVSRNGLENAVDAVALSLASLDLPSSRVIEVSYTTYTGVFEIDAEIASVAGIHREQIRTLRRIGGENGVLVPAEYPIELPNTNYSRLRTTVGMPLGSSPLRVEAGPSPRDPRMAYAAYASGMLAMGGPKRIPVLMTIAPTQGINLQRTWVNEMLRRQVADHGGVLFDVARILAVDDDGRLLTGPQGEKAAPGMLTTEGQVSDLGAHRLASAWWVMSAQLANLKEARP